MIFTFEHRGRTWHTDLAHPLDLSIPLLEGPDTVNCFWAPPVVYAPVTAGSFTGSIAAGGVVNFFNVHLNPHGNGTHTECVGHIANTHYKIKDCLKKSHFLAKLVSVYPQKMDNGDRIIPRQHLEGLLQPDEAEALLVRTLPNPDDKRRRQYSGTNPPYFAGDAVAWMAACGVEHLLTDLPSVDREEDGGQLAAHRAFWRYPEATRLHCTITELFYAPDTIPDGFYLLNLQTAAFDLDASPSRPVLFALW